MRFVRQGEVYKKNKKNVSGEKSSFTLSSKEKNFIETEKSHIKLVMIENLSEAYDNAENWM
jgi:hypothetical protein